jgi:FemAB-related protein (PEP-CTERM system-associated)
MALTLIDLSGNPEPWSSYVGAHPQATGCHQYPWGEVLERSFGHRPFYLAARDETGAIRGVLPLVHMRSALFGRFLVSVPFLNYGGLLCHDQEAEELLLQEARRLKRVLGVDHIELRHRRRFGHDLTTKEHKVTLILPLEADEEKQWQKFTTKVRNHVRKALKSGLQARVGRLELLDSFYEVFSRNMRDLGTPVYSKRFFREILDSFPETSKIIAVFQGEQVLAAGVALRFRETVEIPWASSNRDFNVLCPNNLFYWQAIRLAIEEGATRFDFGRSSPGAGTYRFKEQWGAEPEPLYWQYLLAEGRPLPELNPDNPRFKLAIRLWQNLPVGLTRLLGPSIVRNIP